MVENLPEVVTAVTTAIEAIGMSVLTRAEDGAAEATVSLGQRLIQKIFRRSGDSARFRRAVAAVAATPGDQKAVAALRLQLKKVLAADPHLASEVADMVRDAGTTVTNLGDNVNIVQTNSGIVGGPESTNTQNPR